MCSLENNLIDKMDEFDVKDFNYVVAVKSETGECTISFPKLQPCYLYSPAGVDQEEMKCVATVKEEKFEVSHTGIAPDDIRIKLDLSDDNDDDVLNSKTGKFLSEEINLHMEEKSQGDLGTTILQRKDLMCPSEGNYKCDICKKSFPTTEFLHKYMKMHIGNIYYKCKVCQKCFARKGVSVGHVKIHTGERDYKCEVCNNALLKCVSLRRKHILAEHTATDTDERDYKCEVCNKWFTTKTTLLRHIKTHTRERDYKCEVCNKCFAVK